MPLGAVPVFMATPPEVHSALLSSGPGVGPLQVAASAWSALSAEYAAVAEELAAVVQTVQVGAWQGAAGERYAAAHQPYLAWLAAASAASAAAAAQQETAAGAYLSALAAMPTPAELAANHATHAALVATNFFGVNTIPIALNEADYERMWIQAATTMTGYHAVAGAAVAASGNPLQGLLDILQPILKSLGISDSQVTHDPAVSNGLTTFIADVLRTLGVNWNPGAGTLNGHVYDYYSNAAEPIWYLARGLELFEDFLHMGQDPTQALQAVQYLIAIALFDWPTHIAQLTTTVSQTPQLLALAVGAGLAPVGSLGGLAGLAGLAGVGQPAAPPALPAPLTAGPSVGPAPAIPVVGVGSGAASVPAAAAPVHAVAGAAPAATPPAAGAGFFPPYLLAPPGIGFDSGLGARAAAAADARRKTPEPERTAAATAAAAQARRQRRRRARRTEHSDAFMAMNVEVKPDDAVTGSDRGAGLFGLTGTTARPGAAPAGLAAVAGLAGGAATPLLPETWSGLKTGPQGDNDNHVQEGSGSREAR